jgi:hypothetical protein
MSEMSLYGEEETAAAKVRARHFYMQATGVDSANGAPFNQLAAMAASDSLLDAMYYYLRRSVHMLYLPFLIRESS